MASDFDNGKQQLHRLMRYLLADPVLLSLLNASPDDEPYTEEQRERDTEAEVSIAKRRWYFSG